MLVRRCFKFLDLYLYLRLFNLPNHSAPQGFGAARALDIVGEAGGDGPDGQLMFWGVNQKRFGLMSGQLLKSGYCASVTPLIAKSLVVHP